jgi:hypothetical protein
MMAPAAQATVAIPAAPQLNAQDVDAFCRQVQALKAALERNNSTPR